MGVKTKQRAGSARKALVSEYEERFGEEGDKPGRPSGSSADQVVFSLKGKDQALAAQAQRRARVLLLAENRDRAREIFNNEYRVLVARQGYEDVPVVRKSVETERREFVG